MSIKNKTEAKIARKLVMEARAKGYFVSVYDGEEWVVKYETRVTIIMAALGSTDSDQLRFRDPSVTEVRGGKIVGTVMLIYGNGVDLISDWTVSPAMEALMLPFEAWTNTLPNI